MSGGTLSASTMTNHEGIVFQPIAAGALSVKQRAAKGRCVTAQAHRNLQRFRRRKDCAEILRIHVEICIAARVDATSLPYPTARPLAGDRG
jgi:hypothetical protein